MKLGGFATHVLVEHKRVVCKKCNGRGRVENLLFGIVSRVPSESICDDCYGFGWRREELVSDVEVDT